MIVETSDYPIKYGSELKLKQLTHRDVVRMCQRVVLPHVKGSVSGRKQRKARCWGWCGASKRQRPEIRLSVSVGDNRVPRSVHVSRVMYCVFVGDIPAGADVDHKCENTMCVNPAHLRLLDRQGNVIRGNRARGRRRRSGVRVYKPCSCGDETCQYGTVEVPF